MGSTPQADVPGNVYFATLPALASRASNAANGLAAGALLPPGQAIQILSAWFVPTASQAGSATNYADVQIVNLGSDGTGTAVLASKSFSAAAASAQAAGGPGGAFTLGSVYTKTSVQRLGVSYASQGNGIALVAHEIELAYRYL